MAFLFGKRKQHREGTPTHQANQGQPPPTSSGNSSLATLENITSSPEQKRELQPDRQAPPIQQYASQPPQLQGPPQLLQRPSTANSNASLYPWSHRRLTVNASIAPFPRLDHASNGIAGKEGEIYFLGGQTAQNAFGDLWMIEAGSPSLSCYQVTTNGEGPGMRSGHAGLLVGNAFILFGGDTRRSERDRLDDTLYLLNTTTKTWARATPPGHRPPGRYGHTLNIIGSKLYVFGGQLDGMPFNDLVSFDLNTLQKPTSRWDTIVPGRGPAGMDELAEVPAARTNHSMITYEDKLYLFGGTNFKKWFNDVWTYDPQTNQWSQLDCIGYIPTPREGHAAALVGDVMYVLGGRTQDGIDQGDLAAFRITTQRWYTFQNMGPAPSPRSGLAMTTYGNKIFVYGGEPSLGSQRTLEELQECYILDTGKIRYPNDSSTTSPPDGRARSQSILGRPGGANGSFGNSVGSIPPPGGRGRGMTPRESLVQSPGGGMGQQGGSRLPRASVVQSSAGPPPQQQAPPPRTNGIPAPRTRTPTSTLQEKPSINSIQEQSNQSIAPQNQPRDAGAVRRPSFSQQNPPAIKDMIREAVQGGNVSAHSQAPLVQERSRSRQRDDVRSNGSISPERTRVTVDSTKQKALEKELEELKKQNAWFSAELNLARRAGYSSMSTNERDDRRVSEPLQDSDRPLMEGLISLKLELARVYSQIEEQAKDSAKKVSEVERQRDVAISEAVYAKARLAAAGGNVSSPGGDSGQADAERVQETNKKLAASIAVQVELKKRLETLEAEVENERRARQHAEETSQAAQSRVDELDNFRNRAASEIEELRLELLDAEKAYRDLSSESSDALAEAKKLRVDKQELESKLSAITESQHSHLSSLTSLQSVVKTSTERAEVLQKQLDEERTTREELERKLFDIRNELESKTIDMENATRKMRDMEGLLGKYSEEAKASQAAVMAGLASIGERNIADNSSVAEERVAILQEQVDSARELLKKSKAQADESGERLAQAMQRIAGLEFQQAQSSKDSIALRRRMGETMEELRRLRSENERFKTTLQEKTVALEESAAKYNALKEILSERSNMPSFDKRRSVNIPSPISAPMSGAATPEQLNRLRDLEMRLEESLRAHRETKFSAEMQAQEVEKQFHEKLEQLDNDYKNAVRYVKQTEKMLKLMKDELNRYKERAAQLEVERNDARDSLNRLSSSDPSGTDASTAAEKVILQERLDDLNKRFIEQTSQLEQQLRDLRNELANLRLERDQLSVDLNRTQSRLQEANASASEARAHVERLEHENSMLDERANEAELKVNQLLDQFESSVDAFRRADFQHPTLNGGMESARESVYGPDARSSIALDSLQTELDALRSHWETTKNNRLSTAFDFDNQQTPKSTEGGELSTSLARWRQRLELEEAEAAQARVPSRGEFPNPGAEKREATAAV